MTDDRQQMRPSRATRAVCAATDPEARLRLWGRIFEHASWGVAVCLADCDRLDLINPAFARIHGYEVAQLEGDSLFKLVSSEDRAELQARIAATDEDGRCSYEGMHLRRDGSQVRVHVEMSTISDAHGIAFRILNIQDITERRQLEEQLRQAQKMEAIGRLAGGIAHDFNNILTAIFGYSEVALSRLIDGDGLRTDILEIQRAAERASRLTGQLLTFSRRQVLTRSLIELNEVLFDMGAMLERLLREDIALQLNYASEKLCVMADRGQIEQVILNLTVNARDAMQKGGTMTISITKHDIAAVEPFDQIVPGDYAVLEVRDTGVGIMSESIEHIFEPFFTTKSRGEGTGLGLATVYGIVKQSGGDIIVDSSPGSGTAFRVYLPLETVDADIGDRPQSVLQRGTETVLVVEDDPIVRALAVRVLADCGYRVLEAGDGSQALSLSETEKGDIDLLVTDVIMPGLSGKDVAYELRRHRPRVRVLFVSGYIDAIVGLASHHTSAPLLEKPFTPEMLAMQVRAVLDDPMPH